MTSLPPDSACGTGHATRSTELLLGADGIRSPALEVLLHRR
jgi:hypothetical protein